jgi:NAD(P)-dependent dehydrogenase (short-subunit alcohol dehydrogenase family)
MIETPMRERAASEIAEVSLRSSEAVFSDLAKQVPLGRCGPAQEIAGAILFLCSDLATYVAGTKIAVDTAIF